MHKVYFHARKLMFDPGILYNVFYENRIFNTVKTLAQTTYFMTYIRNTLEDDLKYFAKVYFCFNHDCLYT
jgi:hypothetical protein